MWHLNHRRPLSPFRLTRHRIPGFGDPAAAVELSRLHPGDWECWEGRGQECWELQVPAVPSELSWKRS